MTRKLKEQGSTIQPIAFDPGLVVYTNLARTAPTAMHWFARTRFAVQMVRAVGVTMGSLTVSSGGLARVAIDPAYADASGKYIQSNNGKIIEARSSPTSYDKELADRLWADSQKLVGRAS